MATPIQGGGIDNSHRGGIIWDMSRYGHHRGVAQLVARLLWEDARNQTARLNRGVAQLVARLLWEQDAGCSNHLAPTIKIRRRTA